MFSFFLIPSSFLLFYTDFAFFGSREVEEIVFSGFLTLRVVCVSPRHRRICEEYRFSCSTWYLCYITACLQAMQLSN